MAMLLKGAEVAKALTEELHAKTEELKKNGVEPCLAILRVGAREDDLAYERGALKRCEKVGVAVRQVVLPEDVTQKVLMENIHALGADEKVHGVLMFRPLPGHLDDEAARAAFLDAYRQEGGDALSLCVLGGVFSEGIDLPGRQLDGVVVVGVGLPQVNLYQEVLRAHFERTLGDGFLYAYMLPGMQKVTQAVGGVICTETDTGVALLLDDRYSYPAYRRLMPEHWRVTR